MDVDTSSLAHPSNRTVLCFWKFYDDGECREAISRSHSEELALRFDSESFGPYKSDMCRLAMLFESGGYYFDTDVEVIADIRSVIPPSATVSTVVESSSIVNIFQGFFAAIPMHPVVKLALDLTLIQYSVQQLQQGSQVVVGYVAPTNSTVTWIGGGPSNTSWTKEHPPNS